MTTSQNIIIRNYEACDREAVRKICCDTAFMGNPLETFFEGREIFADLFTSYYTDYEPESLFVAEFQGKTVGYLLGCKNTKRKEAYLKKIFPKTLFYFIKKGLVFNKKNIKFLLSTFKCYFKGEFRRPKIPEIYSGHLHINIDSDFRRLGLGTKLMRTFFGYLKKNNVSGARLSTFSEQGRNFFLKMGLDTSAANKTRLHGEVGYGHLSIPPPHTKEGGLYLLWEGKTSQWRYILHKDITVSTFGATAYSSL